MDYASYSKQLRKQIKYAHMVRDSIPQKAKKAFYARPYGAGADARKQKSVAIQT